jgi:hypothetical protein
MRHAVACLAAALLASGCVTVSSSSRDHLAGADARLELTSPPDAVAARLVELFGRRGVHLVDRATTTEAVLFRFRGGRGALTSVSGATSSGSGWVSGSTEALGSVFYVTLQPAGGGTRAWFFGRPTVQGREACEPPGVGFPCDGVVRATLSAGSLLTGREEAETLRGVMLELTGLSAAPAAPPAPAAAPAAAPAPAPAEAQAGAPAGFRPATVRRGARLHTAPDEAAPVVATLAADEPGFAALQASRGFRRVRTASGLSGFVADAAVQLAP